MMGKNVNDNNNNNNKYLSQKHSLFILFERKLLGQWLEQLQHIQNCQGFNFFAIFKRRKPQIQIVFVCCCMVKLLHILLLFVVFYNIETKRKSQREILIRSSNGAKFETKTIKT